MLAQSTSALTEGARRMKRNRFATTKATKTSPATRNIAGGCRSGRKWLIHLPTTAGIASNTATANVRRRFATARTAEINTSESKIDTMISPPLISSMKGRKRKRSPRAMRSSTAERRRIPTTPLIIPHRLDTHRPRADRILLDSVSLHRVQWTESIELLDCDVTRSRSFSNPHWGALQHLLLLLSLLGRRLRLLARLLRLERLLIGVELRLVPVIDPVLLPSRKDVYQFPLVLYRRDLVYGQQTDLLLLLRSGDRLGLKTGLREQELFLGCRELSLVCGNGLACCN